MCIRDSYYSETMGEKLKQLPAIDWQDNEFRNIINEIFDFENKGEDYNNKVVFFDQNWDPMPDYLKNLSGMKKIILNNSYRKHQKESRLYDKKMELFRILADSISAVSYTHLSNNLYLAVEIILIQLL